MVDQNGYVTIDPDFFPYKKIFERSHQLEETHSEPPECIHKGNLWWFDVKAKVQED